MAHSFRTLKESLIVGLIGYSSVAVLYAAFDFLAVRGSLYTVDLLGKALFRGLRDPAVLALPIELDMTTIFWFNGIHLLISLVIGFIIVAIISWSERKPAQRGIVLFAVIAGFIITIFAVAILTAEIRLLLPMWSIIVANVLAVLLGGTYLIRKHPGIHKRLFFFPGHIN